MCIFYLEAFLVRLYSLNYQPLIKQMISANVVELVVNFVMHFKASLSATELETAVCTFCETEDRNCRKLLIKLRFSTDLSALS